jgi:hypothetical protein
MPDRFAEARQAPTAGSAAAYRARRTAALVGIAFTGALLSACSSGGETSFSLFAEPGKYLYYTCVQIAAETKGATKREQDLKALMDRAAQSTGGAAVGFIAYKADYVAATEELESLHAAARSKNCDQDPTWRSSTAIR